MLSRARQRLRAKFNFEVQQVVEPGYARRHELEAVVMEMRTALADHLDASDEEAVVFSRTLARLEQSVEALTAETRRVAAVIDRIATRLDNP